ncbi:metallophosphoesterase family protein [Aquisalimonas sp. APHAB1-3]|uniref:metallophosphoesterase family protein n=1 Tax=Aquisalimonas sp. APHAB1-3 TaxID=3402080 RepID=UPI003AAF1D2A
MESPGRHCPLHYRTDPAELDRAPDLTAETLYVIGGLYGNTAALEAVLHMAAEEATAGQPAPTLLFNGDFNWFNADATTFDRVNAEVLRHHALQGNVEAELAMPDGEAGCGCAYPAWVDDATVERSNRIMERLQATAREHPAHVEALARLPRQRRVHVGGLAVGVIHGDPESLAGWGLAVEAMPPRDETPPQLESWFRRAAVDVFACTHTCLPFAQAFTASGQARLVINNGATGMPNVRGDRRGILTRISTRPAPPAQRLYGTTVNGVHCDAVAVSCVTPAWEDWFRRVWPADSPAAASYGTRLRQGPDHGLPEADRL